MFGQCARSVPPRRLRVLMSHTLESAAPANFAARLDQFVGRSRRLYSMPAVAVEVLSLADDPLVDAPRLKRCIERDPALAAKLLRVVNGSFFGLARQVTDLNQAIALLGVKALKLLVLGFSLPDRLFAAKGSDALRNYWTRTLVRAVAARELTVAVGRPHGDEAFLAGLLADIGALVLLQESGSTYLRLLEQARATGRDSAAAEQETFGFDHRALTLRLLNDWRIPKSLVDVIALWQTGDEPAPPARILRLASRLASLVIDERADLWPAILDDAAAHFGLTAEALAATAEGVQAKVDQLAEALRLELTSGQAYRETLEQAHRLMQAISEDAVADLLGSRGVCPASAAQETTSDDVREPPPTSDDEPGETGDAVQVASDENPPPPRPLPRVPSRHAAEAGDLTERLATVVAACREVRSAVSLAVVELDDFAAASERFGPLWAHDQATSLATACAALEWPHRQWVCLAEGKFAVLLPQAERNQALDVVEDLVRRFRGACPHGENGSTSLSVGLASVLFPPRNFPPHDLLAAAERCLYAARNSAGDAVKSIEIF